jgi:hypothetical protein
VYRLFRVNGCPTQAWFWLEWDTYPLVSGAIEAYASRYCDILGDEQQTPLCVALALRRGSSQNQFTGFQPSGSISNASVSR